MSTAILFVHGIVGTPKHFDPYIPLVPKDWTISNITLKGHLGTPTDFGRASMKQWRDQFHEELIRLRSTHDRLFVVAHSMGSLFAIRESLDTKIDAMFLLGVPMWARISKRLFKTVYKVGFDKVKPSDEWTKAAQQLYGVDVDINVFKYLRWPARYVELFAEIRRTRPLVEKITAPTYVYISTKDEMASPKSAGFIRENGGENVKVTELVDSGHLYFNEKSWEIVLADFKKYIVDRV